MVACVCPESGEADSSYFEREVPLRCKDVVRGGLDDRSGPLAGGRVHGQDVRETGHASVKEIAIHVVSPGLPWQLL